MKVVCGWCPKVLVEGGGPVSHGICDECAASLTGEGGVNESSPTRRSADVTSGARVTRPRVCPSTSPPVVSEAALESPELREYLLARIAPPDENGCRVWTSSRSEWGYGVVRGKVAYGRVAHRVVYEVFVGPVAEGLELDHLCRNPGCCNVEHLEQVTHSENQRRSWQARHGGNRCKRGHELTEANVIYRLSDGGRQCATCKRRSDRARWKKHRTPDALGEGACETAGGNVSALSPSAAVSPPPIDPAALVALSRARRAWERSCPQLFLEV